MHVRTWQVAYRGLIPDRHLDDLDVEARASRYAFDFGGPPQPVTWIAVDDDDVLGMVCVGAGRDDDLPGVGEVWALYVSPDRWRSGVGWALLVKGKQLLIEAGFTEGFLWVLRDNARARRFYERAGWHVDGVTKTVEIGGRALVEVRYRTSLAGDAGTVTDPRDRP
jgi:ribosomal protein S18 acetylase RimI-like enzyme